MAHIEIVKAHGLGIAEARKRVQSIEPDLKQKYGVALVWSGDRAQVKATGVSGEAFIEEKRMGLTLTLGLLLRPLAGKLKSSIESRIDEALKT